MRARSVPKTACFPNRNYVEYSENYESIYKTFNGKSDVEFRLFDDVQFIINGGMVVVKIIYQIKPIYPWMLTVW